MITEYYIQHTDELYRIEKDENSAWLKNQFYSYDMNLSESMSYIYISDTQIVGYLMGQIVLNEVHIHNIVVSKNFRNKGIGATMISYLIDKAKTKKKDKVCLEVNSKNLIARKVYNNLGFTQSGTRNKYYNNRDSAILMDLWI